MNRDILIQLFREHFKTKPDSFQLLPRSGSPRVYIRMKSKKISCLGVYNENIAENKAFFSFTKSFLKSRLNVPYIYNIHENQQYYLIEDLGDLSLKQELDNLGSSSSDSKKKAGYYKQAIKDLIKFQLTEENKIDYSLCFPRDRFDKQSILWDLNHFKYFFVKLSGISFDEQALENDFQEIAENLSRVSNSFFLFRDFQSRNIMISNEKLYYIDYQGGRKGALQYDVASLLFEAKTNLSDNFRKEMLEFYIDELSNNSNIHREDFLKDFYGFVFIRILQALGSYGLRGWVEKKALFLQSVPYALKNLKWLHENTLIPNAYSELNRIVKNLYSNEKLYRYAPANKEKLTILIQSFSYRNQLPDDLTGNGGGFIFDCRGINNPGKYPELKEYTGKDSIIAKFFLEKSEMTSFLDDIKSIISRSVKQYNLEGYKHLQLSFGCTGGRHRSVFAAEKIKQYLEQNSDVIVELSHRDLSYD